MQALQRSGSIAIIMLLAILLTACNSLTTTLDPKTTTTNQTTTNQTTANQTKSVAPTEPPAAMMPAATATATMNNNMDAANMASIAITPDMGGNMAALISTGKAMVNGQQTSVLLTNKGFPIYYYKPDTNLTSTCTGDCAKDWPPVLAAQGMMTVSSSMNLPKQLSVHQTANGSQVFYDGHALYTYAADTQAGNATGEGQDMQWYLADFMATAMTTTNTGTMTKGITITPNMAANMNAFVHTGLAAINANKVNVLMTNKDFAVYYYKPDTQFTATCTGDCAKDWPPVLAPQGMMTISSSMTLPKKLSVHQTANGAQVFYDGHALYTYAADTQAGTATGRGEDMQWYLVGFLL